MIENLRCPEKLSPLHPADAKLLEQLNQMIQQEKLRNRSGKVVTTSLDGGLIRSEGDLLYPIVRKIPVLLKEDGIFLDQLN